jgi:hypothetical protein
VQQAGKHEFEIRAPKYGSECVVFIPDGLVTTLAAHVERIGVRPDGWLFVGASANPPHQNTIGYWWCETLRDAGLVKKPAQPPVADTVTAQPSRRPMTAVPTNRADSLRTGPPEQPFDCENAPGRGSNVEAELHRACTCHGQWWVHTRAGMIHVIRAVRSGK